MLNKRFGIISCWAVLFLFAGIGPKGYAEDVAAIMAESNNLYNTVLAGFKSTCTGSVRDYSMGSSEEGGITIIRRAQSLLPKLIFVIGKKATKLVKLLVKDTPILFSLVDNPAQSGLSGDNICGVSLNVSAEDQLQVLKNIAPAAKKVGVVYNPDINSVLINEAKSAAQALGLEIIDAKAQSGPEVNDAISGLIGKIDAFWMIADPLVSNMDVFNKLLKISLDYKIPLMVPALPFVEEGGLLSVTVNYQDIGKQAGEMANQILSGDKSPGAFGVQSPTGVSLAINLKTANSIGLSLPESIVASASKLYNE